MKRWKQTIGLIIFLLLLGGRGTGWAESSSPKGGEEMIASGDLPEEEDVGEEEPTPSSREERRAQIFKRIETFRMIRMTEALNLDEETAARVFSRLRPIDQKRWGLIQERSQLRREMKKATDAGKVDSRQLEGWRKSLRENQQALEKLGEEELKALEGLLTPEQQARYLLFRERFQEELKERIREARERRGDPSRRDRPFR
jgi:Spy/CpxP family protein refolding chaperone